MQLEEGLDTGPIFDTVRVPIDADATGASLRAELVRVGTEQLVRMLSQTLPSPVAQRGEPVYAAKIRSDELRIDWTREATEIDRLVRLGGAWTTFRDKRVKVLAAVVDQVGADDPLQQVLPATPGLRLVTVQPEGKGPMSFADFARGVRSRPGERFA
jgi:methionyl-tRNA formyltransferase